MLYDPKWEVKAEPTLTGFVAWLETKDAKQKYPFWECNGRCLLGQYMADLGIEWTGAPDTVGGNWGGSSFAKVGRALFGAGIFHVLTDRPHTFGAALKRARAVLASR